MQTRSLRAPFLTALGLSALASCGGSSDDSSSGGGDGGSSNVSVTFVATGSQTVEDTTQLSAQLLLSEAHDEAINVNFFWSGTALEFVDFAVLTPPPVSIPAGATSRLVTIQVFEDDIGELDETLKFTLVKPGNANLGGLREHTMTIVDEDEVQFMEEEPNDAPAEANVLPDVVAQGLAWQILGTGIVGNFDVFECNVTDDLIKGNSTMIFTLTPVSGVSEVVLNVLDENGDVLEVFDDDVGGTAVQGAINVTPGQKFYLAVTVEGAGSNYTLDVVGL